MTESRNREQHTRLRQPTTYPREASANETGAKGSGKRVAAGRSIYQEEFQRNHGPDLDEALDVVESGNEW